MQLPIYWEMKKQKKIVPGSYAQWWGKKKKVFVFYDLAN